MPVQLSTAGTTAIDDLLKAYPGGSHPGTVVGLVNKQGEIIYLNAAGPKTAGEPAPISTENVFAIYSCSKVVTGLALLHLAESGKLDLDRPAEEYVPELGNLDIILESTETTVKLGKPTNKITARRLLTHTAGFGYSWYNMKLKHWLDQNGKPSDYKDIPLVNEPGTKWEYGISMDWAGVMVERISGLTLGQYCDEHIFKPLGLKDTTFYIASRPDLQERLTTMHKWDAAASTFTPQSIPTFVAEVARGGGGGGIFSTAREFLEILVVLLNGGKGTNGVSIVSPETYEHMFTNQIGEDITDLGGLGTNTKVPTSDPKLASDGLEMLPGTRKGWGLTFLLNLEDVPGGRKAGSAEWGGIANLFWLADPTSEVGVIIFNNVLPYGVPAFFSMIGDLQKEMYRPGALESK